MGIELGAKNLYKAYGVPSLDLTFADRKSLVDRISGNNLVTFTRSTTATYVGSDGLIKTAAINEPRFDHNPLTRESLGLLIEEARTNLLTYSQDLTTWNPINLSVSNNVSTAPDGTTTADKIIPSTSDVIHIIYSANTISSITGTYTVSIFAKADGYNFLILALDGASDGGLFPGVAGFSLIDGTYQITDGTVSASSQNLGNGWYRLSVTGTSSSTVTASPYVCPATGKAFGNAYFAGNGTSGVLVWGAQVEAGTFPTSYIPTTASTVTRAADVASITGSNFSSWYNQSEGSWFVNHNGGNPFAITVGTDADNRYYLSENSTAGSGYFMKTLGVNQFSFFTGIFTKGAISYGINYANIATSGTLQTAVTSVSPPVSNSLKIGMGINNDFQGTGTIARLTYYPTRLPDTTLQGLTST